jgi:hypothetical protein
MMVERHDNVIVKKTESCSRRRKKAQIKDESSGSAESSPTKRHAHFLNGTMNLREPLVDRWVEVGVLLHHSTAAVLLAHVTRYSSSFYSW